MFLPDWRIAALSLAWCIAGFVVSVVIGRAVYRSDAPTGRAVAWAWVAFVLGSETVVWGQLRHESRCSMGYDDVARITSIGVFVGLLSAGATFALIRARGWGSRRLSALAALLGVLLTCAFFRYLVWFYFSDSCFPRDFEV